MLNSIDGFVYSTIFVLLYTKLNTMGKIQLLMGVFTLASLGSYAQAGKNVTCVVAGTYQTNMDNRVANAEHTPYVTALLNGQNNDKSVRLRETISQTPTKVEQVPATTVNRREQVQKKHRTARK